MSEIHKPKIAILTSGGGSTAEAYINATQDGRTNAEVGLIVCNKPKGEVGIYERVNKLNSKYGLDIEVVEISSRTHPGGKQGRGQTLSESETINDKLEDNAIDHVACMGYMTIIKGDLLENFGWLPEYGSKYQARMSNTHPGPLPETEDTFGLTPSSIVLELGLNQSRHTVHLVANEIDKGPKLTEHPIDVFPDDSADSLFSRIQAVEKATLPYVLDKFLAEQNDYYEEL